MVRVASTEVLVALPRLVIACFLGFYGILFLVYTETMYDLLLNALALGFVLELDEFLFDVLSPWPCQVVIQNLEGLPLSKDGRRCLSCDLAPLAKLVAILGGMLSINYLLLAPFFHKMQDVHDVMCGARQNFVCAQDKATLVMACAPTDSWDGVKAMSPGLEGYRGNAILDQTGLRAGLASQFLESFGPVPSVVWSSVAKLRLNVERSAQEVANSHACADQDWRAAAGHSGFLAAFGSFLRAGYHAREIPLLEHCGDVARYDYCTLQLHGVLVFRTLCPRTCGCADPWSGYFSLMSCPWSCRQTRAKERGATHRRGCRDQSAVELRQTPQWARFFTELRDRYEGAYGSNMSSLVDEAMELGCSVIANTTDLLVAAACHETSSGDTVVGSVEAFCPETCKACTGHPPGTGGTGGPSPASPRPLSPSGPLATSTTSRALEAVAGQATTTPASTTASHFGQHGTKPKPKRP